MSLATNRDNALDVEELLQPIRDDEPAGDDLRRHDFNGELAECRKLDEEAGLKRWTELRNAGLKLLRTRGKDLRVGAGIVEAMARTQGLAGLYDGLRMLRAMQETYWQTMYPQPEPEEGAALYDLRESVFASLDARSILPLVISRFLLLPASIRVSPDRNDGFSLAALESINRLEQSLTAMERKEDRTSEEADLIDTGEQKLQTMRENLQQGIEATDRAFFTQLRDEYQEILDFIESFSAEMLKPDRYGSRAKTLYNTAASLEGVKDWLEQVLQQKEPTEDETPTEDSTPEDAVSEDSAPEDVPAPASRPAAPRRKPAAGSGSAGPIADADDARGRINAAARFLREANADDPVGYLVPRAVVMGDFYRESQALDPSSLPAPITEDRQDLRRLAGEGEWDATLSKTNDVVESPAGRSWLDVHRIASRALAETGHEAASRAVLALLRGWITDQSGWTEATLDDDTPAAGTETRAWIDSEIRPAPAADPAEDVPTLETAPRPYSPPPTSSPPLADSESPEAQAEAMVAEGRRIEAVGLLSRASRTADSGRDRFLLMLRQAEICLSLDRREIATPILEDLCRQVDTFGLQGWEGQPLMARTFAALYQCFRGIDPDRAREAYSRLCRIDIDEALRLGAE